jgi:hypothetical protein
MTAPDTWAQEPGWQYLTVAWFLLWPGLLIGWLFLLLLWLPIREGAAVVISCIALSQYLRLRSLPAKRFQCFFVAPLGSKKTFQIACLLTAFQVVILVSVFVCSSFLGLRSNYLVHHPWALTLVTGAALNSGRFGVRLQLIPHDRVP